MMLIVSLLSRILYLDEPTSGVSLATLPLAASPLANTYSSLLRTISSTPLQQRK